MLLVTGRVLNSCLVVGGRFPGVFLPPSSPSPSSGAIWGSAGGGVFGCSGKVSGSVGLSL
eukprot:CAMPEP_0168611050 /NCGR_PEP_ID=MMETSP0449_2-20121227/2136_1 /TAXON_ID=1082188 /ORGANISM="Strombidium rassoulzadegani, Strain ras09" /LENGTH=59 /DNA_ID=CAMNT_0008651441 /DNA_START=155 /DNA_END=334 /DNA_ORIENTATION=+